MRALLLALGWLGAYFALAKYGVYLLPAGIASRTTLAEYLAMVQIVSLLGGVSVLLGATQRDIDLRGTFFPEVAGAVSPRLRTVGTCLLLAPPVYLIAHALGMYLAFDTLLLELATRGVRAVQEQTGELGRSARADSLWTILPFTVLIAPLGEEVLFRGGLYGAVQSLISTRREADRRARHDESPPSLEIAGLPPQNSALEGLIRWAQEGGAAVLASSLVFGLMHADTPGGMGIVRGVSASCLGIACGFARKISGGLLAPFVLHAGYNLLSLATLRGWIVTESFPTKYAIPTLLVPLSLAAVAAFLALFLMKRRALMKR